VALTPAGHAIECRIYAEDPDRGFLPSPGWLRAVSVPGGPGVRDDRGAAAGYEIPSFYDSLISKLVVWGDTRAVAIGRLQRALDEYRVVGVKTTLPFFRWLVRRPEFAAGEFSTTYLDERLAEPREAFVTPDAIDTRDTIVVSALAAWLRAHRAAAGPVAAAGHAWRQTARREGLR
jgi:acetyl/propionyl-CoA carboxylase alpha subunit